MDEGTGLSAYVDDSDIYREDGQADQREISNNAAKCMSSRRNFLALLSASGLATASLLVAPG